MKRFTLKKKALAAVAASALVVGVAGAAFGFWTTGGSGTGSGSTSSAANVAITVPLGIGNFTGLDTTKTFDVLLTNPNTGAVNVSSKTLTLTSVDCTGGVGGSLVGVPSNWFDLGGNITPPAGTIPGSPGTATIVGTTLTLNGQNVDQDVCQGAVITGHFSLT